MSEPTQHAPVTEAHKSLSVEMHDACQEEGDTQGGAQLIADFCRDSEAQAVAEVKEWNAQRTSEFACTEQRLATRIAELEVDRDAAIQRVEAAEAESLTLREKMDAKIEDFLNERMCCNGQDCGCMGVTRREHYIFEEAGTELTALRAQVAALTDLLAVRKTLLEDALGIFGGARMNFSPTINPNGCSLLDKAINMLSNTLAATASVPPADKKEDAPADMDASDAPHDFNES